MEKKIIIIMMALLSMRVYSQNTSEKEGIIYKINDDGSHYLQATVLNQTWVRLNQNNSGTMVDGIAQNNTFDIGLRRTRMQVFGQVTDRAFVYFQFGQNNFNAVYNSNSNRKVAAFFHDALCEFNAALQSLYLLIQQARARKRQHYKSQLGIVLMDHGASM